MKQQSDHLKVATDMFFWQLKITSWYLPIVYIVHVILVIISTRNDTEWMDFFILSHGASHIYMLILGIILGYSILPYYVKNGVTRKNFFIGSAMATIFLSLVIAVISGIVNIMDYGLWDVINVSYMLDGTFHDVSSNWLYSVIIFTTNILTFYLIGWFIGSGYYRYGWIKGFGIIAVALLFQLIANILWAKDVGVGILNWIPIDSLSLPLVGSLLGELVLIIIIFYVIRVMTKRIAVRI
ncbi:hypothetical protein QA612_11140 [Evansella sp. AB-P1]|uniref:hypothetical protein n=1 Tax=Evansella sp. AB-P1 TaxID=3037653 RepID=UPI00241E529F|nr:hypothetical protein [Evansella sp. AB-P1]MDG5788045.1 hypothetical protein [Evansella sp. AB-P1]